MRKIRCFAMLVLFFLAMGICAAKVPDLRGIWTGSWSAYDVRDGDSKFTENGSIIMAFVEQKDRIFAGNIKIRLENKTEVVEGFAGAIGLDNKTLYITEFDKGYVLGTIISNDELELIYLAMEKRRRWPLIGFTG